MAKALHRSLILFLALLMLPAALPAKTKKEPVSPPPPKINKKDIKVDKKDMESDRDLKRHVKRYRGEVCIEGIPMIDQGSDPSCAIATLKRLLDYYSEHNKITMGKLGKAMGYDKSKGTNVVQMVEQIKKYSSTIRLSPVDLYKFMWTVGDLKQALTDYNKVAERRDQVSIPADAALQTAGFVSFIRKIDYKAWKKMRGRDKAAKGCWESLAKQIDQGIPVLWSVNLGLYNEQKGNGSKPGGHMRMIIGYNDKKKQIIYTDSWGSGHEKKYMSWEDAWAITQSAIVLLPRN